MAGQAMIYGLIVSHGRLAEELLTAANKIEGPLEGVEALCLEWGEPIGTSHQRIEEALARLPEDAEVIIFTDMFGGTPSNVSISFLQRGKIEIVTGVNLPMVVKFGAADRHEGKAARLAEQICEKGARAIRVASNLLSEEPVVPEEPK